MEKISGYGFECPIHGLELQCFCFRAFDEKTIGKWKKIKFVLSDLHQEQEEEVIQWIREQKSSPQSWRPTDAK